MWQWQEIQTMSRAGLTERSPLFSIEYTGNNEEAIAMGSVLLALAGIVVGAILLALGIVYTYHFFFILGFLALAGAFIVGSYGSHPPVEHTSTPPH